MERKNPKIKLYDVLFSTSLNKNALEKSISKAEKAKIDVHKDKRKDVQECKFCFYIYNERIGGAAMTKTNCGYCEKDMLFSSTNIDKLCKECAGKLGLCKCCGADFDLKERRKLERK